jgi:hypothetical protein
MMPYTKRKKDGVMVRLDTLYTEIMAVKFGIGLDEQGHPLTPNDEQLALGKEVLGERIVDAATGAWYDAESFLAADLFPHEFSAIPIHSRAQWMAAKHIDTMIKNLERYREVIDRQNKEALSQMRSSKKRGIHV